MRDGAACLSLPQETAGQAAWHVHVIGECREPDPRPDASGRGARLDRNTYNIAYNHYALSIFPLNSSSAITLMASFILSVIKPSTPNRM